MKSFHQPKPFQHPVDAGSSPNMKQPLNTASYYPRSSRQNIGLKNSLKLIGVNLHLNLVDELISQQPEDLQRMLQVCIECQGHIGIPFPKNSQVNQTYIKLNWRWVSKSLSPSAAIISQSRFPNLSPIIPIPNHTLCLRIAIRR